MKRLIFIILSVIALSVYSEVYAQTFHYSYKYTITDDGMKFEDSNSKIIQKSFANVTFSNNKSFVCLTNSNGVSRSNMGYRHQYNESGFRVYLPSSSGLSNEVGNLANQFLNTGEKAAFGWSVIGISFSSDYNTMLVHQSNGSNQVYVRTADPNKPNIRY